MHDGSFENAWDSSSPDMRIQLACYLLVFL